MNNDDLGSKLEAAIRRLDRASVSSNASYNAPVDKSNLEKLQREVVIALTSFKQALLTHLAE